MLQLHLQSRVGRRLFTRFLIAALLPICGLAWFSYQVVGKILVDAGHQQLTRDGKSYGMSLVESLNRLAAALQIVTEQSDGVRPSTIAGFTDIAVGNVSDDLDPRAQRIQLRLPAAGTPELVAILPGDSRIVTGKIDADRFWNNDSAPELFCVFTTRGEPLHCSPGLSAVDGSVLPTSNTNQNSVVTERHFDGTDYLLGFWYARFLPTFNSAGFVVMVALPKEQALGELAQFQMAFPAVVLLAIALAVGFSIGQIRQQMAPLDRLQHLTQRLSTGDLRARADIASNDEFGHLGLAFDRMAAHLEHKFHMLGLLSELDRAILGSSARAVVIETLLRHVHLAIACDGAGLIAFDEDGGGQMISCSASLGPAEDCDRIAITAAELANLPGCEDWCELAPAALPAACMNALSEHRISHVLAFPAHANKRRDSLLLLAFATRPDDVDELVQAGRSLADRLAIAASSIAREQMLYQQAHYDMLTGLPNRHLLRDRIEQAIAHANRTETSAALLFVDLDGFKQVNDSLGHSKGDTLLIEYARRLRERMRESDTVARLGGDEFVVLIPDLARDTAYATIDSLARDLSQLLAAPFPLADQGVFSPASIGIALYPDNAVSHEELLMMADEAMYESKRRDTGGYRFYTSNISALTRDRFELTQELRDGIQKQEMVLHFQPKVDARNGRLAGAEALLRWRSPKRGLVPAADFVNLLDEMGLSTWLGEWVLETACAQMRAWDEQGFSAFPVSINVSPLQFDRTPVLERVQAALEKFHLHPSRLEVEILESMAANESLNVRQNLIRLRELGVQISLDDFGTGFSSLVHLTQVPADIVKLDRVFIQSLCTEPRQREIVELIIALAKVMNLKVVAEGVEDEAQRQLLPELGCDLLQGYLIGRPVAPDEFASRWLETGSPGHS